MPISSALARQFQKEPSKERPAPPAWPLCSGRSSAAAKAHALSRSVGWRSASSPYTWSYPPPSASRRVTIAPTLERAPTWRCTRATPQRFCGTGPSPPPGAGPSSSVRTARRPTFHGPVRPVSRPPTPMGTWRPSGEMPIRREKKTSSGGAPPPPPPPPKSGPNRKIPAFSRKNSRFSGKKREKRVRFTRCSSTSVSAKSVL